MNALADRITMNPNVMMGKPTIRGLRITVEQILKALAAGLSPEDLLEDYPELSRQICWLSLLLPAIWSVKPAFIPSLSKHGPQVPGR